MHLLAENPHHPGLRTSRVQGTRLPIFEARIDAALRMTFSWDGPVLEMRNNCRHDEVYRNP
jgi:hypothetical protein